MLLRPIYFNMGRKAANNNKRESKREAEREKVFWSQRVFGDKKDRVASGGQRLGSRNDAISD